MTLEEYPALATWRRRQLLRPMLPAMSCVWTETIVELADELARDITVEVECPDCEGRGYVDYSYDTGSVRALGGRMFTVGTPMRQDHFARITSSLRTDGLLVIDGDETLELDHRAVASHSDLVDGRVTTTERRWCACYDDPAPVLGRRTHALAGLIRAHVKREPWAAAELYVLAERDGAAAHRCR